MELNVVTDGLKTLMHKLTELLQQSLVSNVDDNANTVADTIVEIITFGNKLSVETNSVIKRARKHEADLVSCLKQMKDVIKIQKSQMLNYTSISASCKSTMTDAQPQSCTICEINERVSIQLKQEIDTLRCGADILRRQLKQNLETAGRWSPGHMQQLDGKETWGSIFTHPQLVSEGPSTLRADGNMSRTSSSRPPLAPASRYVRVAYSDGDGDIDEEEEGDTEFDEGQDHLNGDSADADDPDEGQDTPWGDEKRHNGLDARANRDSEEDEQQAQDLVLRDYGGNGSAHDKHNCPDRRTGHKSERAQIQAQAQDTKNRDSTKNYGEQAQVDVCAGGPSEDERLLLLDIQTPADDDDDLSHTYSSSFNSDATNASCSSGSSGCSSSNIKSIGSMCSDERDTSSSSSSSSARKEEDQCYDAFDHSSAETYENYTGDSINWVADFDGSVEDSFTLIQNFYEVGKTT